MAQETPQQVALAGIGLQRDRSYFSPEPFEHYDSVSGNLVLTFVDLSLPANAGRRLEFQRTFNHKGTSTFGETSRWTFGIAGMVMRVIEQPVPANYTFSDTNPQGTMSTTPVFLMGDGSSRKTMYVSRPSAATAATAEVMSTDFFRYDRQAHSLRMPDGTTCSYDPQTGRLTSFADPFGNQVTLLWTPASVVVTQNLGNAQVREITLPLDASSRVTGIQYAGHEWAYVYGHESGTFSDITTVTLPNQSNWTFDYNGADLTGLTTPMGGRVDYTYEDFEIATGPEDLITVHTLKYRDTSGRGVTPGHWQVDWLSDTGTYALGARITTPSVMVEFKHGVLYTGSDIDHLISGNYGIKRRSIYSGGQLVQQEDVEFTILPTFSYSSPFAWWGTPEVSKRIINRDGRNYETWFTYSSSNLGDYHRPRLITETGHVTRATTRTYSHSTGPWILGLLTRQDVTVGAETFRQDWAYDLTTGFLQSTNVPYKPGTSDPRITTNFGVDQRGNVAYRWPASLAQPTYFAYDWGRLSVTETPAYTDWATVNPDGTLADETIGGRTTTYQYDSMFRQTVAQSAGNTHPFVSAYDDANGTVQVSRGTSYTATTVDGFGRPISTFNSAGVSTNTLYDPEGRVVREGLPYDALHPDVGVTVTYDALDRVARRTNPDTSYRHWTYSDGTVVARDERGVETFVHLQAFGHPSDARVSSQTDAAGSEWLYTYDPLGRLKSAAGPDSIVRTWSYNGNGLLSQETHPESGTTSYSYDSTRPYLLKQKTDAKNVVTTYSYDANERLIGESAGGKGKYFTYEYGSNKRQSASTDDVHTVYSYDEAGRLATRDDVVAGKTYQTRFEYDLDDNVIGLSYPSRGGERRRVGYDYDSQHRIARVFELAAGRDYAFGFSYHPSGAVESYTSGNLVPTSIAYDDQRNWTRSIDSGPLQLAYPLYDLAGNVTQVTDGRPGMDQAFSYDVLSRLSGATGAYGSLTYPYDAHGNRTTAPGGATIEYYTGTNRLKRQGVETYTYDNNGNLITAPNRTYTHTPQNMLETATVGSALTRYTYDADQWRVSRVGPSGTTYFFRGLNGELLTEWTNPDGNGEARDYLYAGSRLIAAVKRSVPSVGGEPCGPLGSLGPVTIASGAVGSVPFCGTAGQTVSAAITLTSGTSFGGTWYLTIKGPTGTTIGTTWTGSGTLLFLNTVTLPTNGTYTVEIDPTGTLSGTVDLTVFDVRHITGSIVADGPLVTVAVNTPGQNGKLTFSGTAGQAVSASMRLTSASSYSTTWYLNIKSPSGSTLRTSWVPSGGTLIFADAVTLPADGVYTVEVDPSAMALGTVAVNLYTATGTPGTVVADGTPVSVHIDSPGEIGRLTFAASAGQVVSATITLSSQPTFNSLWELTIRKPDGSLLSSASGSSGSQIFLNAVSIPTSGNYTLEIDPSEMSTGAVDARLYSVSNATGSVTVNGSGLGITTNTPGQNAVVSFVGTASQVVRVRVTGNTIGSTNVYLRKPDGSTMTSKLSSATSFDLASQTLPVSGTYSILVDPVGPIVGGITIAVTSP